MENIDFRNNFIENTKKLISEDDFDGADERNITLQLNVLLGVLSLPIENTKFKKRNAERRFFEPCVSFLKEKAEIEIGEDKKDRFIMMDLRDAIAHLHIETENEEDEIKNIIFKNEFHNETNFMCRISAENLKSFCTVVLDEYEKYCDKINLLSNR